MSLQDLQNQLSKLADINKQTFNLITRLGKLPFQPGSVPLQASSSNPDVRVELSQEIHQSLKQQTESLELLQQEIDDFNPGGRGSEREREKARLHAYGARLGEDLKLARTRFRKAQLTSKKNAEAAKQKERELLFAGASEGGPRKKGREKLSQDELLVNASSDVTAALRRTHQLMESELSRSQFAHDTLEQSTAALATLGESYGNLSNLLKSSRNLLSSLLRSQKSDTWYLESAFYILLSTIIWLIFRRLLYGPLWWTIWLPLKLSFRLLAGLLSAIGLTTKSSGIGVSQLSSLSIEPSTTIMQQSSGAKSPEKSEASESLSESIGKMAEKSQTDTTQGAVTNEEKDKAAKEEDAKPNRKKRMWEGENEAGYLAHQQRDEL